MLDTKELRQTLTTYQHSTKDRQETLKSTVDNLYLKHKVSEQLNISRSNQEKLLEGFVKYKKPDLLQDASATPYDFNDTTKGFLRAISFPDQVSNPQQLRQFLVAFQQLLRVTDTDVDYSTREEGQDAYKVSTSSKLGLGGANGIDITDLVSFNIFELYDTYSIHRTNKLGEKGYITDGTHGQPTVDIEKMDYVSNDDETGDDHYYNYDKLYAKLKESAAQAKGTAFEQKPMTQEMHKYLAYMLIDPEILQYCLYFTNPNGDVGLVYLKDVENPKILRLEKYDYEDGSYTKGYKDVTQWLDPDKYRPTDSALLKPQASLTGYTEASSNTLDQKVQELTASYQTELEQERQQEQQEVVTTDQESIAQTTGLSSEEYAKQASKTPTGKQLSPGRIKERYEILLTRSQESGSVILRMMNFFGIDPKPVLGLIAANSSIPDHELKLTFGAAISATVGVARSLHKKLLPAGFLGLKEKDSEYIEEVGQENTELQDHPETISKTSQQRYMSQAALTSNPRKKLIINKDLDFGKQVATMYVGKNTTITTPTPLKFYKTTKQEQEVKPQDKDEKRLGITLKETKEVKDPKGAIKTAASYTYTVNTRCFAFPDNAVLKAPTNIEGHARIGKISSFNKYNTN
jgi:hypothetical protein